MTALKNAILQADSGELIVVFYEKYERLKRYIEEFVDVNMYRASTIKHSHTDKKVNSEKAQK